MNQPDSNANLTVALRRMHRWRMAFFGLVLMISGGILGAAVAVLIIRPEERPRWPDPREAAVMMALRLKEELGLSVEQEGQIKTILQTQMQKLDEMRKAAFTQIETVMQATQEQMGKVLSEEQRDRLEKELEEMRRQLPGGMRRGPGGPGRFGDRRDRRGPFGGREGERGPREPRGDWPGPRGPRGWEEDPNGPPKRPSLPMDEPRPAPEPNETP